MNSRIFVSVGKTFNARQERFVSAVERRLITYGLDPQRVGRNVFANKQPLRFIRELMDRCDGTVVIALERFYVKQGLEMRGSDKAKPLDRQKLPTVWNQIEAAMAYTLRHPLLIITEEDIRRDGLLEANYDWYILHVKPEPEALDAQEVDGQIREWAERVKRRRWNRLVRRGMALYFLFALAICVALGFTRYFHL